MADIPEFTWKNWWHYHKWWVLGGAAVLIYLVCFLYGRLTQVRPDYQAAYVGDFLLSQEDARQAEEALAALGQDLNGDGQVVVWLNQYPTYGDMQTSEALQASTGYSVKLTADLMDGTSCIFLLEDPKEFQIRYEVLEPDRLEAVKLSGALEGLTLAYRDTGPQARALWEAVKEKCE